MEVDAKAYESMQPFHVSKILAKLATDEKADIVFLGKQVCLCNLCNLHKLNKYRNIFHVTILAGH